MSMTLLDICNATADEVDLLRPVTIANNPAPDAQKLFRYANKVGARLMRAHCWQALRKQQTFSALGQEEQTGALPSDFDRFVAQTFWNFGTNRLVSGPISPVEWQGLRAVSSSDTYLNPKFIYRGGAVSIFPAPGAGDSMVFEYVNKNWATSAADADQAKFLVDTDTSKFNEDLIIAGMVFEWLEGEGQPSVVAANQYQLLLDELVANDEPTPGIAVAGDIFGPGRHFDGTPPVRNVGSLF